VAWVYRVRRGPGIWPSLRGRAPRRQRTWRSGRSRRWVRADATVAG